MARIVTYDGAAVKGTDISNWTRDEWVSIFGSVAGLETDTAPGLYASVGWLYACVNLRARRVAAMPWSLYRGETVVTTNDGDMAAVPYLDGLSDLLYQTEAALCLGGQAFWYKRRNGTRAPMWLRWMSPTSVTPIWSAQGIVGFERQVGNERLTLAPEDVLYFRLPNPMHESAPGPAPAAAALSDAAVLRNMARFVGGYFDRGAIKATLLTVEGNPARQEMEKLEAWWKRFFSGVRDAWGTAAVKAGVTPVVVGEGLESLTNASLTMERRESIATALGVPHSLVAANAANFATAQQDEINMITGTIVPACRLIERVMNREMFQGLGLRFAFQPERLSAMQEDEEQRATSYATYVNAGIKPSIAAQMVGLSLPDGVTYEDLDPEPMPAQLAQAQAVTQAPMGSMVPMGDSTAKAAELRRLRRWAKGKRDPDVDKFESDVLTRAEKMAALGDEEAATGQPPFGLATHKAKVPNQWPDETLGAYLAAEARSRRMIAEALAVVERELRARAAATQGDITAWTFDDVINEQFSSESEMYAALEAALRQGTDLGVSVAFNGLQRLGFGFDYTLVNDRARMWAATQAGQLVRGVQQTTIDGIRAAVAARIESGAPLPSLIDDLTALFGRERASAIAVTETTRAYAEANRQAYVASGVVQMVEWRTANDDKTCPICGPLNGQRAMLPSPRFPNAVTNGDIGVPPAHVNCRCWIAPVVIDQEEIDAGNGGRTGG